MLKKTFICAVKELKERSFRAIASDESLDRDQEIIRSSAWTISSGLNEFKANSVILYAHDSRNLPVAKAVDIGIQAGKLMVTVQFPAAGVSQLSDETYGLVRSGILTSLSVGFLGNKWEYDQAGHRVWTDVTLLEISLVPIPANPGARVVEVKSSSGFRDIDLAAIPYLKKKVETDIDLAAIELSFEDSYRIRREQAYDKELERLNIQRPVARVAFRCGKFDKD